MEEHNITILLLGDKNVGKSTFLSRISQGKDRLRGRADITLLRDSDQPFLFELRSRKGLYKWIKEVRSTLPDADSLPILVLGLKRDLRSEDDPNGIIYPQEGHRIAQEMRADNYMECSAVTGELLSEAFEDVFKAAVKTTTDEGGQSEGGCGIM
ncbi:hypothetical protein RB601_000016 [Gaeumannomyces tritici]